MIGCADYATRLEVLIISDLLLPDNLFHPAKTAEHLNMIGS